MSSRRSSVHSALLIGLCLLVLALVIAWFVRERMRPPESAPQPKLAATAEVRATDELALVASPSPARDVIAVAVETPTEPTAATADSHTKHRLHGLVRPANGRARLASVVAVGATNLWGEGQSVYCLHDGTYAFEDLAPGRYWLRIGSVVDGRADAVVDVFGDTQRDLQLSTRNEVAIRVVDELGRPVEGFGLFAAATLDAPGEWIEEARVGWTNPIARGRFHHLNRLSDEAATEIIGRLFLDTDPPLHVSLMRYQRVLATQRIEPGAELVEFVLRSDEPAMRDGSIKMRVIDSESKAPVKKATAVVDGAASRMQPVVEGACEITALQAGTYRLQFLSGNYAMERREVFVPPGTTVDLGDVPLRAGHSVSGRVLDETGKGLKFNVRFDPCEADGRMGPQYGAIYAMPANADGSFQVTGLTPGFHRLEVVGGGELAECVAVFDVREGPVKNVTLHVTAGILFVVDPSGKHGADARFTVLDEKGVRIVSRLVAEPSPVRVLLAPGRYTVEFQSSRDDPDPRMVPFEIVREPVVVQMR